MAAALNLGPSLSPAGWGGQIEGCDARKEVMSMFSRFVDHGCIYRGARKKNRSRPLVVTAVSRITLGEGWEQE